MLKDVFGIQHKVREHSKRSLKWAIPLLGVQREEQRKAKQVATRDENAHSITIEPHLIMQTPKERMNQDHLQSLQEEEYNLIMKVGDYFKIIIVYYFLEEAMYFSSINDRLTSSANIA
jgi:hypothetical protein